MICGKIIFKTKEEAGSSLSGMNEDNTKGRAKRQPHQIYYCSECDGFHLTSKRKKSFDRNTTFESNLTRKIQVENERKSGNKMLKIRNFNILLPDLRSFSTCIFLVRLLSNVVFRSKDFLRLEVR